MLARPKSSGGSNTKSMGSKTLDLTRPSNVEMLAEIPVTEDRVRLQNVPLQPDAPHHDDGDHFDSDNLKTVRTMMFIGCAAFFGWLLGHMSPTFMQAPPWDPSGSVPFRTWLREV